MMKAPQIIHVAELTGIPLTSGNDGQGRRWFNSAKVRKSLEADLVAGGHQREPFSHPVTLRLIRVLGPRERLWDADNLGRGNSKQLIDALVAVGWLVDDGPKWVEEVRFGQDASQRPRGPMIKIEVWSQSD